MTDTDIDQLHDHDDGALEAYCMSCKQSNPIEAAEAVWTRKGTPATRGMCSVCGTTVFRMGGTPAHQNMAAPKPISVAGKPAKKGKGNSLATFVTCASADAELAQRIAEDLKNSGYPTWLEGAEPDEDVAWASGVHPALNECTRLVVVLSAASASSERVATAWQYFRDKRKQVVIALVDSADVPEALRRSPRFAFGEDYKVALRQMVQALM